MSKYKVSPLDFAALMLERGLVGDVLKQRWDAANTDRDNGEWAEILMEVTEAVEDAVQDKPPVPGRQWVGDEHPCIICGNYGGFSISGWTRLCKKHKAWWDLEYQQYHPDAGGAA